MSIYLGYYLDMRKKKNPGAKLPSLDEIKKNYIEYLLAVTDNNMEETARILEVSPTILQKKIKKFADQCE